MGSKVVREEEREFNPVDWGRSKTVFGPDDAGTKYLRVGITEYAPGGEHKLHKHPDQEEVIYGLEGEGIAKSEEGDKPIRPGSFVFIPAGADHATINVLKDRPMKAVIIKSPPREGTRR